MFPFRKVSLQTLHQCQIFFKTPSIKAVPKPLLLCSPLGFASSEHWRAPSQSARPFQSGQTFEKNRKTFLLHLKSELLWLTWLPCCGCWWGGRPPPACCNLFPSAAASLQAGTGSPWSLLLWNNFRKVEIMVSLSLPAVKQLLMGKGYSKQEESDLLTNIYNRAVKWVSPFFFFIV